MNSKGFQKYGCYIISSSYCNYVPAMYFPSCSLQYLACFCSIKVGGGIFFNKRLWLSLRPELILGSNLSTCLWRQMVTNWRSYIDITHKGYIWEYFIQNCTGMTDPHPQESKIIDITDNTCDIYALCMLYTFWPHNLYDCRFA